MAEAIEIPQQQNLQMNKMAHLSSNTTKEIEQAMKNARICIGQNMGLLDNSSNNANSNEEEAQEVFFEQENERVLSGDILWCRKEKECGHQCRGCKDEEQCLPCLEPECIEADSRLPSCDDLCTICYTSELKEQPSIKLTCGHVFHANCILELLKHKWSTLRITFAFMSCPSCKQPIEADHVSAVATEISKLQQLREEIQTKALQIVKKQGLDHDERITTPGDFYFNNLSAFAEAKISFFECSKCAKAYFGGLIDCEQEMGMENSTRKEDLICKPCLMKQMSVGRNICTKGHGASAIDWKCMFCCSVALFMCKGGTLWFCDDCHKVGKVIYGNPEMHKNCNGVNCPLNVPHPPPSRDHKKSAFPLGCSICRAEHQKQFSAAHEATKQLIQEVDDEQIELVKRIDFDVHSKQHIIIEGGKLGGGNGQKKAGGGKGQKKAAAAAPAPYKFKARPVPKGLLAPKVQLQQQAANAPQNKDNKTATAKVLKQQPKADATAASTSAAAANSAPKVAQKKLWK